MKITVCSEDRARQLSNIAARSTAIISITCPGEDPVAFDDNPNIQGIFRMQFNDIDHDKIPNIPPPKQSDFDGLKVFVDGLRCEELIVHCGAGMSRSAATAAAIAGYLGGEHERDREEILSGNGIYFPNSLVLKYACRELGIEELKTEKYYSDIFGEDMEREGTA